MATLADAKFDEPITYDKLLKTNAAAWMQLSKPERAKIILLDQKLVVNGQRNKLAELEARLRGIEAGN